MTDLAPDPLPVAAGAPPAGTATPLGRVVAPPEHESTSGCFYFWVDRDQGVERTQIVRTRSVIAGRTLTFVGIIQEVYRRSRQKDVTEEAARYDGRSGQDPPFASEGVTYAEVAILRTNPVTHAPPTEESEVFLASDAEAGEGYGFDRMGDRLDVGLLRNGGTRFAGRAALDLDFLLGKNGGHLNVNGIAGLGAKSSLLLAVNWLLLREAARQKRDRPSDPRRLRLVPVVFNVKNFDLFFLDRWNRQFQQHEADHRADWRSLGVDDPQPFDKPDFFAPQEKGTTGDVPVGTGRTDGRVTAYSWSLSDVIKQRVFRFLFAEEDVTDANFGGLVGELEEYLTTETGDGPRLRTHAADGTPHDTFQELLDWFRGNGRNQFGDYVAGTKGKFLRRLKYVVQEGDGVLRRRDPQGRPLVIPPDERADPIVIDLFGLHRTPDLQRFVVAAVFHQIVNHQSGKQVPGRKFLITLDELNRFAPRGASDPITRQIETVAAEMRSQGVILLGAQQQASLVSQRVIENAAVRAVGRSGSLELGQDVWRFLGDSFRRAATQLQPDEKLLYLPSFREPMLAKVPFPPFALSESDAAPPLPSPSSARPSRATADFV